MDEIPQALKHVLKEESCTYSISRSLLKFLKGVWSLLTYTVIIFAFEPEVVQQSDTGMKPPIGFINQWGQRCDSRYWRLLSSTVIYLAAPQHILNSSHVTFT